MTVVRAEEKPSHEVLTAVSSTTLSGYVSTSAIWHPSARSIWVQSEPASEAPFPPIPSEPFARVSFLSFTNDHARLRLMVPVGSTNTLEVSTNLVTWFPLLTCVHTNDGAHSAPPIFLTHSNLTGVPLLYYRFVNSSVPPTPPSVDPLVQTVLLELNRAIDRRLFVPDLPPLPPTDLGGP